MPMLPEDPPPMLGLNTHRSRVEHKRKEAQYFYERLRAKEIRYRKLAKQKNWKSASEELTEWMFCASALISATRSTYYYLKKSTKARSENRAWLESQEHLPIHEIGKQLRDFMLHEATPNTSYETSLPPPKAGESKGDWIVRGLFSPQDPRIAISVTELLTGLSPGAAALGESFKTNITELFGAILQSVDRLISEAAGRNMLSDDDIGPAVSTKRTR